MTINLGEKVFVISQKNKSQVSLGNKLGTQTDTKELAINKI